MSTYTPDEFIEALTKAPGSGPEAQRAIALLLRMKAQGTVRMSTGTWAPGHPNGVEDWAKHWSDVMEVILDGGSYATLRGTFDNRAIYWIDRNLYGPIMMLPYRLKKLWRALRLRRRRITLVPLPSAQAPATHTKGE